MPHNEQESVWARPARGSRGPAPSLNRPEIAAAAIRLADDGGLSAASMRALATALGTAPGSLYRYVSSKDQLFDLMIDATTAEVDLDAADTLVDLARKLLANYLAHPWLLDIRQQTSSPGPRTLDLFEHCLRALEEVPAGTQEKMQAIAMLIGNVTLFARAATTATTYTFHPDPNTHPLLTATGTRGETPATPTHDLFERTVTALVRGLLGGPAQV